MRLRFEWKNTRSPGWRSSLFTLLPMTDISLDDRGRFILNTLSYMKRTNPEQSNPAGVWPPKRYRVPKYLLTLSTKLCMGRLTWGKREAGAACISTGVTAGSSRGAIAVCPSWRAEAAKPGKVAGCENWRAETFRQNTLAGIASIASWRADAVRVRRKKLLKYKIFFRVRIRLKDDDNIGRKIM